MTPLRSPSAKRLTEMLSDTSEAYQEQWEKAQALRKTVRELKAIIRKHDKDAKDPHAKSLAEQHREHLQERCQELWLLLCEARDRLAKVEGPTPERNGASDGH